jgi:hypothetical protein
MSLRFYVMPVIGTGTSFTDAIRPAYVGDGQLSSHSWAAMDYGNEPTMLVMGDVTPSEQTAIAAHADVIAAPADLTALVGSNLVTVQTALESVNIPADWVTSGMTFRAVLRWVSSLFQILQRFNGLQGGRFFPVGITLNSTVGDLSAGQRQKVQAVADSLGLNTAGITLTTTIRAALKILADQQPFAPFGGHV